MKPKLSGRIDRGALHPAVGRIAVAGLALVLLVIATPIGWAAEGPVPKRGGTLTFAVEGEPAN